MWHVCTSRGVEGPFELDEVRARIASGALAPSLHAWHPSLPGWTPIRKVPDLSASAAPESAAEPSPGKSPSKGRFRLPRMRLAGFALFMILAGAVGAGAFYGYQWYAEKYAEPVDFTTIVPAGVRLYSEDTLQDYDDAGNKLFADIAAILKENKLGDLPITDAKLLGYRIAFAVYGADSLEGKIPAFLAVLEWKNPAEVKPVEEKISKALGFTGAPQEKNGWMIQEKKDTAGFLACASRGPLRIVSNSRKKLDLAMTLAEGTEGASLSRDAAFMAALPPMTPTRIQRSFLDLDKILGDIHPFVSIFGGEDYAELKTNYLDHFKYITAFAELSGGTIRSTMRVKIDGAEKLFEGWGGDGLRWPEKLGEGALISMSFAPPPGWEKVVAKIMRKAKGSGDAGRMGEVQAKIGSINGALSMYFADHEGDFPVAKTAIPVMEIEGMAQYMQDANAPWGESITYEGDKSFYILKASHNGKVLVSYDSKKGIPEVAPDAELALADVPDPMDAKMEVMKSIHEVGVFIVPHGAGPKDWSFCAALRTGSADDATKLAALIGTKAANPLTGEQLLAKTGEWIVLGREKEREEGIAALSGASASRNQLFQMSGKFRSSDFKELLKDVKLPELTLNINSTAKLEGTDIVQDATISPDIRPLSHAFSLAQWTMDQSSQASALMKLFTPRFNVEARGGGGTFEEIPADDMSPEEMLERHESLGRNQAALSAAIY